MMPCRAGPAAKLCFSTSRLDRVKRPLGLGMRYSSSLAAGAGRLPGGGTESPRRYNGGLAAGAQLLGATTSRRQYSGSDSCLAGLQLFGGTTPRLYSSDSCCLELPSALSRLPLLVSCGAAAGGDRGGPPSVSLRLDSLSVPLASRFHQSYDRPGVAIGAARQLLVSDAGAAAAASSPSRAASCAAGRLGGRSPVLPVASPAELLARHGPVLLGRCPPRGGRGVPAAATAAWAVFGRLLSGSSLPP